MRDAVIHRMNAIAVQDAELKRENPAESVLFCCQKIIESTEGQGMTMAGYSTPWSMLNLKPKIKGKGACYEEPECK